MYQLPSPPVVATVQHEPPARDAPAALVPYVRPIEFDGVVIDWQMTDDAVAFGQPGLFTQYLDWRSTWERIFVLDPLASIARLTALAAEFDESEGAARLDQLVADRIERLVAPDAMAPLMAALTTVNDAVRRRGSLGFGVVDATEGVARTGLAAAWSPGPDVEVLAADDHMTAELDGAGVHLCLAGGSVLEEVVEVIVTAQGVRVDHAGGTATLPLERAAPLGWLVPGAARWRIRQVPEVLVWARTLAGVEAAGRYASALGLPVRLTTLRQ